ncbi:MAG: hypothetical protein H6710_07600 [Myxococcales bacterium]|nr:hypothetical protein [Myxococcales bacterium]MCB9704125.1 hypothetical protein [Myxococcales bacterium]
MAPTLPKGQLLVLRILWGSMLGAQVIFTVMIVVVAPEAAANADPEVAKMLLPALGAAAFAAAVAALTIGRVFARKADYQAFCILRWALGESVGIFGLVLAFMGAQTSHALAFTAGAALVLLSLMPGSKDHEGYQQARLG